MNFEEVKRDFERLETIRGCNTWTWVYESFRELLENPTKKLRKNIYHSLIHQWFSESGRFVTYEYDNTDEVLPDWALDIAEKYGIEISYME